jgi:hypothetical protein
MGWTRWLLYAAVVVAIVLAALRPRLEARAVVSAHIGR